MSTFVVTTQFLENSTSLASAVADLGGGPGVPGTPPRTGKKKNFGMFFSLIWTKKCDFGQKMAFLPNFFGE